MRDIIDRLVNSVMTLPDGSGLIVGVLRGGSASYYGYGSGNGEGRPTAETVYEIGSISKVFTAVLLATMLNDGLVELDEQVRTVDPALSNLPPQITLLSLATHTSGLPKMPSDMLRSMFRSRGNPYARYSVEDMLRYLSRCKPERLQRRIGKVEYSNLGMGLLGHILAQKLGVPFERAVVTRVCDPLGMQDTRIELTSAMVARLAPPCLANGKAASNWEMPAFEGAGGLRSTAKDVIAFLQANVEAAGSPLTTALRLCQEIRSREFAPAGWMQALASRSSEIAIDMQRYRQGVGLGWVVGQLQADGSPLHWHHGATGGYRAFSGFVRDLGLGVAVLANTRPSTRDLLTSSTATDVLGFRILEELGSLVNIP